MTFGSTRSPAAVAALASVLLAGPSVARADPRPTANDEAFQTIVDVPIVASSYGVLAGDVTSNGTIFAAPSSTPGMPRTNAPSIFRATSD